MKIPGTANLLLLAFSILLSSIALETVLRHFLPIAAVIYQLDDHYLHRLIPDSRKLYGRGKAEGGQRILVRINSAGCRGEELRLPKTSPRIVFYGDSFIAAEFSREENTLAKQVESYFQPVHSPPPQAINAGVVGYGPDQILLRVQAELDSLAPDLTVVAVFSGNDYGDLLRNKIYRLDEDDHLVINDYRLSETLRGSFDSVSPLVTLRVLGRIVDITSRRLFSQPKTKTRDGATGAATEADTVIDHWLEAADNAYRSYVDGDIIDDLFNDYWDGDIALTPSSASALYKVKLMRELLREFQRAFAKGGRRWLLLIIPSPVDVCVDYPLAPALSRYPDYRRSRLSGLLTEIAQELEIPHLDLFEHFQAEEACDLYFPYGNDHWNDRGQELAARLLVDFIQERRLLEDVVSSSDAGEVRREDVRKR